MGKIFIITGTYSDKPNSEFKAKIAVGKDGRFKGYCEKADNNSQSYQYLCGDFRTAILLMSNAEGCYPILYMINGTHNYGISDRKAKTGTWKMAQFSVRGDEVRIARDAEIQFEQIDYDPKLEEELHARYEEVNLQTEWNAGYTVSHYTKINSVIGC